MSEKSIAVQTAPAPTPIKFSEPKTLLDRVNKVHEAIERCAYEIFQRNGGFFGRDLDDWFEAEAEILHPVRINLTESGDGLTAELEVPGFEAKDLEISLEPRRLTISGEKVSHKEHKETGKAVCAEECRDEILRVVYLPEEVDSAKTTASLKDGRLDIRMPKIMQANKRVEVKAA